MTRFTTLRLLPGDQLNAHHFWLSHKDPTVLYTLMELRQETDYTRLKTIRIVWKSPGWQEGVMPSAQIESCLPGA